MSVIAPQRYAHTPYEQERATFMEFAVPQAAAPMEQPLPEGTLHPWLHQRVTFIPYPATVADADKTISAVAAAAQSTPNAFMNVRTFVGQLPYHVTEPQLIWICAAFNGHVITPQRILKTNDRGERLPTGGVHVFCDDATFVRLEQTMHKRVLIDDTGLWFAATAAQKMALDYYVQWLHSNRQSRPAGRPYDTVVVQAAMSTFVPRRTVRFDGHR